MLESLSEAATTVFRHNGMPEARYPFSVRPEDPPMVQNAQGILTRLHALDVWRRQEDLPDPPVLPAIQLGALAVMLNVRLFEPHAKRGRDVLVGARESHQLVHGSTQAQQARWKTFPCQVDSLRREHPRWSHYRICNAAAYHFRVTVRTIERRTNSPQARRS